MAETIGDPRVGNFTYAVTFVAVAGLLPSRRSFDAGRWAANQDAMTEGGSGATEARSISRLVMV